MLDLLNRTEPELQKWVASQGGTGLRDAFESMWAEIRGARLAGGQPRSPASSRAVELSRVAEHVANLSGDETLQVEAWRMLAYSLTANEQHAESLPYYQRSLEKLEARGDLALASRVRIGYVGALKYVGQYEEALRIAAVAEGWLTENGDDAGFARLCSNIGGIYFYVDDHVQSYRYYLMATETFERIGDRGALVQCYINLGNALSDIDQFQQSEEAYAKAEKLSKDLGLTELWAQAAYNHAWLYYLRGLYSEALNGFSKLRPLFEESGSRRHIALCDVDEAEIYLQLNLSRDAAALARRAHEEFKVLGFTHDQAKAHAFLGIALFQLGKSSEALEVFQSAQREFETEGNIYWVALLNLYRAEVHLALKRFWEARSLATAAKISFGHIGIPSKRVLSLVMLARIALELNDVAAASVSMAEIDGIVRETAIPLLLFPYHILRGDLARRTEDWLTAEDAYEQAAMDLELNQNRIHHDDLRVTFFNGRNRAYEELVWLKLRDGSTTGLLEGYAWCERAKSRALVELLAHHSRVQAQAEDSLLKRINQLREELNLLYMKSQPELRPTSSEASYSKIAHKEDELARTLREVSREDPEYASLQQVSTATLASVQQMLPENTTMIEYFVARDEVLAFVVSRREASVERHLCPVSRVADLHQRLAFQLEKFMLGPEYLEAHGEQIDLATKRHLKDLYEILVDRLVGSVATPRITIVPHGILHLLPFHAFFDGEKYLIDRFELSYAPSASVLKYCLGKEDIEGAVPSLIGVADPNVPFVEDEIRAIANLFPDSRVLIGEQATRDSFARAVARSSFLHIATHAVFRQDNPMFSGFKLQDGWLTAFDFFSMSCQTNLVTLSGCKSGMNQVAGSDDLMGLVRGFLYSGARSLLVSLWNVDDKTTFHLMIQFYHYWRNGTSRSAALSQAMRAVREELPSPFYWAPFLLIGKAS